MHTHIRLPVNNTRNPSAPPPKEKERTNLSSSLFLPSASILSILAMSPRISHLNPMDGEMEREKGKTDSSISQSPAATHPPTQLQRSSSGFFFFLPFSSYEIWKVVDLTRAPLLMGRKNSTYSRPPLYPTNNALLIKFLLSSNVEILLTSTD